MATLTLNNAPGRTGAVLTTVAVAADVGLSDQFDNTNGNSFLYVRNGSGITVTVTLAFASGVSLDGSSPANKTYTMLTLTDLILGPFPANLYNDTTTQRVTVSYSAATSVKVYAFKAA